MLTIFVGPKKQIFTTTDGTKLKVYPMFVKMGKKMIYIEDCPAFPGVDDVRFGITKLWLPYLFVQLNLTPEVRGAVVGFLQEFHAKQDLSFSCLSFACLVAGVKEERPWDKYWKEVPRRRRKVADIIFVTDQERKRWHAAVYVGLGMYLSVYGAGGDLVLSTLKDMKKAFESEEVLFVEPCI